MHQPLPWVLERAASKVDDLIFAAFNPSGVRTLDRNVEMHYSVGKPHPADGTKVTSPSR